MSRDLENTSQHPNVIYGTKLDLTELQASLLEIYVQILAAGQ